jgi:hypothetical protein
MKSFAVIEHFDVLEQVSRGFLSRMHNRLAFELGSETLVSLRLRHKTPPSANSGLV